MKNKQVIFISLIAVLAAAMLLIAFKISDSGNSSFAAIYVNSQLYQKIDLDKVKKSYTVDIPISGDKHNIILVEPDGISMQSADCPDKLCVKQGKISGGAYPIVCLPHKIIISLEGEDGTDAVTR